MADIFLSYEHEDRDRAADVVDVLEAKGWLVWWDRDTPPGQSYREFISDQLDKARCVVVLWSHRSVRSNWVEQEAQAGLDREVLIPARLDDVVPPLGFKHQHYVDLFDEQGNLDLSALEALIGAVKELLSQINVKPVSAGLITGDRHTHKDMGPTINLTCQLTSDTNETVEFNRLEIVVTRDSEPAYELISWLLYDVEGLEHKKTQWKPITVAAGSTLEQGIQFVLNHADGDNVWQAGNYEFKMLGWVDRDHARELRNLITTFNAKVSPQLESDMARKRNAPKELWDKWEEQGQASDRAIGLFLYPTDIWTG